MNIQNKSILFVTGLGDTFFNTINDNAEISLAYFEIIQNFYNNGYRRFVIELNNESFSKILLESAFKVKDIHNDAEVISLLPALDNTVVQPFGDEPNIIIAKKPYSEDKSILSTCDKMILPIPLKASKKAPIKCTLIKSIESNSNKLFIYELPLPLS